MKNKTNNVPWPYYFLDTFLEYHLEGLINTYERKKVEAFFNQCRFMKKKSQRNRLLMNQSFYECSEYKHKIKQVRNWIKEFGKERDLQKENERLKQQIEKMKNHNNCKWFHEWNLANVMDEPLDDLSPCQGCKNFSLWKLAE